MTAILSRVCLVLSIFSVFHLCAQEPLPPLQAAPVPPPSDSALSAILTQELRSDPLFSGMMLTVDLYNGLAIVHGGAPSQKMADAVNEKLRNRKGIEVIFNYMTIAGQVPAVLPQSISATYDSLDRLLEGCDRPSAFVLAGRVLQRLRAAPGLETIDFSVDAYRNLVILHGTVSDAIQAERARDIARYTDDVGAVLSYIQIAPPVSAFVTAQVEAAPVLRRTLIEAVPARFETIVPVRNNCNGH